MACSSMIKNMKTANTVRQTFYSAFGPPNTSQKNES